MSVPDAPPSHPPPAGGRPQGLGGCLTALLVVVGMLLLLPGLCSLVFMGMIGGTGGEFILLWVICLLVGVGGVVLIQYAIKNR